MSARHLAGAALAIALMAAPAAAQVVSTPSRTTSPNTDEGLFQARCGYCHAAGGTGAMTLGQRLGAANALLDARGDLQSPYIQGVVRHGLRAMPVLSRVELTDAELRRIAGFLTRNAVVREASLSEGHK